jgi:hypothetical protein
MKKFLAILAILGVAFLAATVSPASATNCSGYYTVQATPFLNGSGQAELPTTFNPMSVNIQDNNSVVQRNGQTLDAYIEIYNGDNNKYLYAGIEKGYGGTTDTLVWGNSSSGQNSIGASVTQNAFVPISLKYTSVNTYQVTFTNLPPPYVQPAPFNLGTGTKQVSLIGTAHELASPGTCDTARMNFTAWQHTAEGGTTWIGVGQPPFYWGNFQIVPFFLSFNGP